MICVFGPDLNGMCSLADIGRLPACLLRIQVAESAAEPSAVAGVSRYRGQFTAGCAHVIKIIRQQ